MKTGVIFLVGICVLFSVGAYTLGDNLPAALSKIQPLIRNLPIMNSASENPQDELSEPEVDIETEYYEIYGETDVQVASTMDFVSPVWISGKQHRASTHSPIRWRFRVKESADSCAISKVEAKVWIKYTYPKWKNFRAALPELQEKWKAFMTSLVRHEEGHKNIAVEGAREILRAIREMGPRSSCSDLEYEANEIGYEIIEQFIQRQHEFDEDERNHYYERGLAFP